MSGAGRMVTGLGAQLRKAQRPDKWVLGNKVLYDLCRKHPKHHDVQAVLAKIWLIGRSYAAAIERRRTKDESEANDDFYLDAVAPAIIRSDIDIWIARVSRHRSMSEEALEDAIGTHGRVTELFNRISDLNKRSLASKYLHFHVPSAFYLYDSRAVQAMRSLSRLLGRSRTAHLGGDEEYRRFAAKCFRLQQYARTEFRIELSPRQLDRFLLKRFAES